MVAKVFYKADSLSDSSIFQTGENWVSLTRHAPQSRYGNPGVKLAPVGSNYKYHSEHVLPGFYRAKSPLSAIFHLHSDAGPVPAERTIILSRVDAAVGDIEEELVGLRKPAVSDVRVQRDYPDFGSELKGRLPFACDWG